MPVKRFDSNVKSIYHRGVEVESIMHCNKEYYNATGLSASVKAAIYADGYSDSIAAEIWAGVKAYAKTHRQLVSYINSDPDMYCSLPISASAAALAARKVRYIVGDGTGYFDTNHIFSTNAGKRRVKFKCTSTGSAYRYWGSYQIKVGRSLMCYPINNTITLGAGDGTNCDYSTGIPAIVGDKYEVYMEAANQSVGYEIKRNGSVVKTGIYAYQRSIVVPDSEPIFADKENGSLRYRSPIDLQEFWTYDNGTEILYIPCKLNGVMELIDINSLTLATRIGTFTEVKENP